MDNLKNGANMYFKIVNLFFIAWGVGVNSINAKTIDCKIQELNLTSQESAEIYKENTYRKRIGNQDVLVSNFSINNEIDFPKFKRKLDSFIKNNKGEIDISSSSFIDLVRSINDRNMLAILNIFGENKYDGKTKFYFKETKIKMRYKDVVNELLMSRLGESLWARYYPYPSWNIPMPQGKYIIKYPYDNKFTLSSYDDNDSKYYGKPILKPEREWRRYNGNFEYYILLSSYYDRNTYYTWRYEWGGRENRNNGEWSRNYNWLEKTINEYKGTNNDLIGKLTKAKESLEGMCD